MHNLLKTDFKRFMKDKAMLVLYILCIVFTLFSTVLMKIILMISKNIEDFNFNYSAADALNSAVSPVNNTAFIIPLILSIILVKDYTHGTIRNKIITGNSKSSIFMSSWITTVILGNIFYFVNALLNWGIGLALFGVPDGFDIVMVGETVLSILVASLAYTAFISLFVFFSNTFRNVGLTIVGGFAVMFLFSLLGALNQFDGIPAALANLGKIGPSYYIEKLVKDGLEVKNCIGAAVVWGIYSVLSCIFGISCIKSKDIK